jgi:hypothetical protein
MEAMSIHMYAYRIPADRLWDLHAKLRTWAARHSQGAQDMIRAVAADHLDRKEQGDDFEWTKGQSYRLHERWSKAPDDDFSNLDVRLQVFHEPQGTLLVRILAHWDPTVVVSRYEKDMGHALDLEQVFCQTSTDMSDEDRRNLPVARWVDDQVRALRYSIIKVFTSMDAWHMMFIGHDDDMADDREWLDEQIEIVKDERDNPRPLTPQQLRMLSRMLHTSFQRDLDSYDYWRARLDPGFARSARGRRVHAQCMHARAKARKIMEAGIESNEDLDALLGQTAIVAGALECVRTQTKVDEAVTEMQRRIERLT